MYYININDVSSLDKHKRLYNPEPIGVRHTPYGVFVVCRNRETAEWFMHFGSGICFILDEGMTPRVYIPQEGMYDQTFRSLSETLTPAEACYG